MGQSAELEGRRAERAGPGMRWGLKSAEKPHPWAVDHEPWGAMGPGAMGPWAWVREG